MPARGLGERYQGSKWIRKERRLAIYLRDGLACVYCGANLEEDGVTLSLDHVVPHVCGGGNLTTNLVTACRKCNSSRGDRALEPFVRAVAVYLNQGVTAESILAAIRETVKRPVDVKAALRIIQQRGSWQEALRRA